jgi:ribosomal protein L37AE/L43A
LAQGFLALKSEASGWRVSGDERTREGKAETLSPKHLEEVMTRDRKGEAKNEVGVELKYCEHCGSLWVRARGAGTVYCDKCQPKVADLPAPKMKSSRLILPVRPHAAIEDYELDVDEEDCPDFEAVGGVA